MTVNFLRHTDGIDIMTHMSVCVSTCAATGRFTVLHPLFAPRQLLESGRVQIEMICRAHPEYVHAESSAPWLTTSYTCATWALLGSVSAASQPRSGLL